MRDRLTSLRFKNKLYRSLAIFIFTGYGLFMCYLLFFGFSRAARTERMMNLVPFKTISNYITGFHHYNLDTWVINLFGNVAAFVPFGFWCHWFSRAFGATYKSLPGFFWRCWLSNRSSGYSMLAALMLMIFC